MKRIALFGLLLLLLAGCVDYNEELWLNKDGSGKVRMTIGVQTSYENDNEINRYVNQPGISLISKSIYRKKNFTFYNLEFKFKNLEAFNNLNDQISNADFFGRITLTKEKDGSITLKRRIALGSPSGEEDEIEQLILAHTAGNLKWHYKLHLPWKIIKANAAAANIDYKNNTVSWEYQTSYLWSQSQTMTVRMKQPFPWIFVIPICLVILVIVISLIWWRRQVRKIHKLIEKEHKPKPETLVEPDAPIPPGII
jgi:hypothetical protein